MSGTYQYEVHFIGGSQQTVEGDIRDISELEDSGWVKKRWWRVKLEPEGFIHVNLDNVLYVRET